MFRLRVTIIFSFLSLHFMLSLVFCSYFDLNLSSSLQTTINHQYHFHLELPHRLPGIFFWIACKTVFAGRPSWPPRDLHRISQPSFRLPTFCNRIFTTRSSSSSCDFIFARISLISLSVDVGKKESERHCFDFQKSYTISRACVCDSHHIAISS